MNGKSKGIHDIIFFNLQKIVYIHQHKIDNCETSLKVGYTSMASALGESLFKYLLYELKDSLRLFGLVSVIISVETYDTMNMLLKSIIAKDTVQTALIYSESNIYKGNNKQMQDFFK